MVGDRARLIEIGVIAVLLACVLFGLVRLAVELTTGRLTPWWGNLGGAALLLALYVWFRGAPARRSSWTAHGVALIATLALLIPTAYGMPSSKWWLSLVGFGVLLMGRRSEAVVWTAVTLVLLPAAAVLEDRILIEGAHGEDALEAGLAAFFYVVLLLGITAAFRRVADSRARELAETAESLERSNLVRSRFLAHMSHDLRTPLHGVMAMTDLALQGEASEEVHEQVQTAQDSAQVLLTLLNNILDVTRAEADAIDLAERPFLLHETINEILRPMLAQARAKGVELTVHSEPGVAQGRIGDRVRFAQILLNVVGNAIKFTREGRIEVHLKGLGADRVQLVVSDTGVGIPTERLSDVFAPFTQASTAQPRSDHGAGLGLAIARRLCRLMGGELSVTSELGIGSTFVIEIELPADPDQSCPGVLALTSSERLSLSRDTPPAAQPRRILVCEDEDTNRRAMRRMLVRFGHEVVTVEDGVRAWEILQEESFDVLFTDLEMPAMGGLELTRRIREREQAEGLPRLTVVAATAHVGSDEQHHLLDGGADAHLPKPFTLAELEAILRTVSAL